MLLVAGAHISAADDDQPAVLDVPDATLTSCLERIVSQHPGMQFIVAGDDGHARKVSAAGASRDALVEEVLRLYGADGTVVDDTWIVDAGPPRYEVDIRAAVAAERIGEDRLRSVQVRAGRGAAKAAEMLDALARLELSDGMALDRMLREEAPGLSRELALIIITPSLGRSLMQSVARLRFWGFTVTVMLIDNQPHYDTVAGALEAEHVRVLHVRSREELHQIARSGI